MSLSVKDISIGDFITKTKSICWHNGDEEIKETFLVVGKDENNLKIISQFWELNPHKITFLSSDELSWNSDWAFANEEEIGICKRYLKEYVLKLKESISEVESAIKARN